MAQAIFPNPDNSLQAQSVRLYNGAPLLATWSHGSAWLLSSGALVQTPVSGVVSGIGFVGSASDGSSGQWLAQYTGTLVHFTSGGALSILTAPTSGLFTGCAFASGQTRAYAIDTTGVIWVAGAASAAAVTPALGITPPARFLTSNGTTLYTLVPAQSGVATLALSSSGTGTSGFVAAPFAGLGCLAASGSLLAVGGWTHAAYGSGYVSLAMEPSANLLLGVQTSAGRLVSYARAGNGTWAQSQTISGIGSPVHVAWAPSNVYAFTADTASGVVRVFTNTVNVLAQTGTLSIANANATAITTDSQHGLVAQKTSNQLTALGFTGSAWATSGTVALAAPTCVVATGALTAVAGFASGIAYLQSVAGVWSMTASAALPFAPSSLALDPNSAAIYASATSGASGFAYAVSGTTLTSSQSWTGSGNSIFFDQGQIAVLDGTNALARVFGVVAGALVAETTTSAPTGATSWGTSSTDFFAAGTSDLWQFEYNAPYTLRRTRLGQVSIYNGTTWASASFGATGIPVAVTWDSNGNVTAVMLQNLLYTVSGTGTIVSGATIPQFNGQPQTVPLGISGLLWVGSSLYASTVLNDSLIQVL
jgi:hypothetical protein